MDDVKLHKEGINRLGNVLVPNGSYGTILEKKLIPMFEEILKDHTSISTRDVIDQVGARLDDESSFNILVPQEQDTYVRARYHRWKLWKPAMDVLARA